MGNIFSSKKAKFEVQSAYAWFLITSKTSDPRSECQYIRCTVASMKPHPSSISGPIQNPEIRTCPLQHTQHKTPSINCLEGGSYTLQWRLSFDEIMAPPEYLGNRCIFTVVSNCLVIKAFKNGLIRHQKAPFYLYFKTKFPTFKQWPHSIFIKVDNVYFFVSLHIFYVLIIYYSNVFLDKTTLIKYSGARLRWVVHTAPPLTLPM